MFTDCLRLQNCGGVQSMSEQRYVPSNLPPHQVNNPKGCGIVVGVGEWVS